MKKYPPGLTVGYVTSWGLSSALIEWRSAGGPSHATTLTEPGWVVDARLSGGVRRRPVSYLAGSSVQWFRVPAPISAVKSTLAALESQIGTPYDWRDIIDFAFPQAFRRVWRDPRAWICSELQAWAEEKGGIIPKVSVNVDRLAPSDIKLMNEARGAILLPEPIFS